MSERPTTTEGTAAELSPLKRAFLAIDRLQTKVRELEEGRTEPIALIGIGCRFPGGASSADAFAQLLRDRVDAVVARPPVPRAELEVDGAQFPPAGYLEEDVAAFDPMFFGTAPREAASMDPQQRLVLECVWEALEDAGINPRGLEGSSSGVFIGVASTDWAQLQLRGVPDAEVVHTHFAAGVGHSMVSGRVSYTLGLHGPSISIDTACSSSLVSLHMACQSLRSGECDLALSGGVNLILAPDFTIAFQQSRMLSEDGRCRTFDAEATGFSRGEGCGVVVLKRLRDALRDGDRVIALVRGSAVNQDGPSSGLTAPHGPAQEAVIRSALRAAGVEPASVTYVEAHGTGTILGDPIEVQALDAVYRNGRDPARPLLIGSVKTNFGHLEAAAGIAGFIKAALAVRDGVVPAQLHFRTPNPHIPWERLALTVASEARKFETGQPRRAGVSSFGFSGTNVHVIVEEPTPETAHDVTEPDRTVHVLPLSARSPETLRHLADNVATVLGSESASLADVCHTAGVGRAPLSDRVAVVGATREEVRDKLTAWVSGAEQSGVFSGRASPEPQRVAFLFTGQGAQRAGMGQQLFETEPVFREVLSRAADVLSDELAQPFLPLLFGQSGTASSLTQTAIAQPALVSLELALCALWRSWGVRPERVIGHSVGEYAAAIEAGVMSFEDGLRLIAARGRLMQALPSGGAMMAIFAGKDRLQELLAGHGDAVSIAALNAPDSTVVSGAEAALSAIADQLLNLGIQHRRLAVSHAFHSRRMEPMIDAFRTIVAGIRFAPPRIPLISNVTGVALTAAEAVDPDYWCRHIRMPVLFGAGVSALHRAGSNVLLECGPDGTLCGMAGRSLTPVEALCVPSLRPGRDEQQATAEALAALHATGVEIDWAGRDAGRPRRRVALPVSAYARSRHWFSAKAPANRMLPAGPAWRNQPGLLLGSGMRTPDGKWVFERAMNAQTVPFVADHVVNGQVILPATGHLDLLLSAARIALGWTDAGVQDLTIREALVLEDSSAKSVQVCLERTSDAGCRATIHSLAGPGEDFRLHAEATIVRGTSEPPAPLDEIAISARCTETIDSSAFYAALAGRGLTFGPAFRSVARVQRTDYEALAVLQPPPDLPEVAGTIHPALLDAGIQALAAALPQGGPETVPYLPIAIDRVRVHAQPGPARRSHVRLEPLADARVLTASVVLFDATGAPLISIDGIHLARARSRAPASTSSWVHRVAWTTRRRALSGVSAEPTDLVQTADAALTKLSRETGAEVYAALQEDLESLSAAYFQCALFELGWRPRPGDFVDVDTLLQTCGVQVRHRQLVRRMLRVLEQLHMLRPARDAGWEVLQVPPPPDAHALAAALLARYRPHDAELGVTIRCGKGLPAVLRGTADPLELLFPGGDTSAQGRIYRETPVARSFNGALASMVRAMCVDAERPLRILEIGAGTGGTTAHVLDVIPTDRVEYTFTDIGRLFVNRAREAYGERPYMRFDTLDIDRDPAAQGFQPESYDLIIASNVLHATRDLRSTLSRVRTLLAPDGALCLFEVTRARAWVDLTVGLTDGWWLYEDHDLRLENPVLTRSAWLTLLGQSGFSAAAATAEPAASSGLAGQSIILARRAALAPHSTQRWLILGDARRLGGAFAERLQREGTTVSWAESGSTALAADPTDVAVFWPADQRDSEPRLENLEPLLGGLLQLVQTMVATERQPPRLHLVTQGAQPAGDIERLDPVQSAVCGMARSIVLEHPELRCRCLDLDPGLTDWDDAAHCELVEPDAEREVAFRNGERRVPRLTAVPLPDGAQGSRRLCYSESGLIEDLRFETSARRAPLAHEIEIEVQAAGLNFRDVVHALGVRADAKVLGTECVGRIVAKGSAVTSLTTGDLVLAAGGAIGDYATIHTDLAVRVPDCLSIPQAATLPIAFLTAWRALHETAHMQPGQKILIHAAAGGVGMAAVQLAVAAGLEVYATAGTAAKRDWVRALGARGVFDSRSLAFVDEVMRATGGTGVEIVLNSLAGEFIPASLRVIAQGGTLIELGKEGGWDEARVRATDGVRPNVRYVPVDLSDDLRDNPGIIQAALQTIVGRVAAGELHALPCRTLPFSRAQEAFRLMAAGRHTGKLVLVPDGKLPVRDDGTYLITGGLSGLGLRVAEHLVQSGARSLALAGRSTPSADAETVIARMRDAGATVTVLLVDVATPSALEHGLADVRLPLRGVVHCAGVLRDGALVQQTWDNLLAVLRPKVMGMYNLENVTREAPLDFFLLFSSMAATFGSAGQANHAAANAFLDAAAVDRVARGLPAASLAWGAWSEIGAATRHGVNRRAAGQGFGTIDPESGLQLTDQLAVAGYPAVTVSPIQWDAFLRVHGTTPFFERVAPRISQRAQQGPRSESGPEKPTLKSFANELAATPPARRHALLQERIRTAARRVLGLPGDHEIDERQPLGDIGLDSLMAVELRNALGALMGRSLPATLLFDHPTVSALTRYLATGLGLVESAVTGETSAAVGIDDILGQIEGLSQEEVERRTKGMEASPFV